MLDKLKHVPSAEIDALKEEGCMGCTRVTLLDTLRDWSEDPMAHRIFWLDGMAGTGKSAIARSLCRSLREASLLGGSFFCRRQDESRSNTRRILPSLAWSLAFRDSQYQASLLLMLQQVPNVAEAAIEVQFKYLFEKPFCGVSDRLAEELKYTSPILVIDALDECADNEEVEQLLQKLLGISPDFPVKFFLTSRPEIHIREQFKSPQSMLHRILRLHDIDESTVTEDIRHYLTVQLKGIGKRKSLDPDWPGDGDIEILTRQAGTLFIYAATAIKYIGDHRPIERLQKLTKTDVDDDCQPFYGRLDEIYTLVLSAALDPKKYSTKEICQTKQILGAVLASREPLHLSDLARLLGVDTGGIRMDLDRIHAVIFVPPPGTDGFVYIFHASFADYLTLPCRAPENMTVSLSDGHRDLANGSLQIMKSDLYFNISNCRTSYLPNRDQPLATISQSLKYSCLHWSHHIIAADDPSCLLPPLEDVLLEKFLFWLEVLSLTEMIGLASSSIMRILTSDKVVSVSITFFFLSDWLYGDRGNAGQKTFSLS